MTMAEPSQILLEGSIKYRDNKKWKSRWAIISKLSPIADSLQVMMYKNFKEKMKTFMPKTVIELEHYLGIESGFTYDKESNTMAIICVKQTIILAFDVREILLQWQAKLQEHFCKERHFLVQVVNVPNQNNKIVCGSARLLLQDSVFCLVSGIPPRLNFYWSIKQLRRFGLIDGKFCFEGGSQCGKGAGLHILYTSQPEELSKYFELASNGQLNLLNNDLITKQQPIENVLDKKKQRSVTSSDSSTGDSCSQLMSSFDDTLSNYYINSNESNKNDYHSTTNLDQECNLHLDCSDMSLQHLNTYRSSHCMTNITCSNMNKFSSFNSNTISRFSNIKPDLIECYNNNNNYYYHHHNHHPSCGSSNNSFVCYHHLPISVGRQVKHSMTSSTMMMAVVPSKQNKIINCDHESSSSHDSGNNDITNNCLSNNGLIICNSNDQKQCNTALPSYDSSTSTSTTTMIMHGNSNYSVGENIYLNFHNPGAYGMDTGCHIENPTFNEEDGMRKNIIQDVHRQVPPLRHHCNGKLFMKESIVDHPYHKINFKTKSCIDGITATATAMENYDIPRNLCLNTLFPKSTDPLLSEKKNILINHCVCDKAKFFNIETEQSKDGETKPSTGNSADETTTTKICSNSVCDGLFVESSKSDRFLKEHANCFHVNGTTITYAGTCGREQKIKPQYNGYFAEMNQCDLSNQIIVPNREKLAKRINKESNQNSREEMNYENMYFINTMQLYENMCFPIKNQEPESTCILETTATTKKCSMMMMTSTKDLADIRKIEENKEPKEPTKNSLANSMNVNSSVDGHQDNNLLLSSITNDISLNNNNNDGDEEKSTVKKPLDLTAPIINSKSIQFRNEEPKAIASINDCTFNSDRRVGVVLVVETRDESEMRENVEQLNDDLNVCCSRHLHKPDLNSSTSLKKCGNNNHDNDDQGRKEERFCTRYQPELIATTTKKEIENFPFCLLDLCDQTKRKDCLKNGMEHDVNYGITNLIRHTNTTHKRMPHIQRRSISMSEKKSHSINDMTNLAMYSKLNNRNDSIVNSCNKNQQHTCRQCLTKIKSLFNSDGYLNNLNGKNHTFL